MLEADEDLLQALGLALAMTGSVLEGEKLLPRGEFGRKLALMAAVTAESNERQAMFLGTWAHFVSMATAPKAANDQYDA